MAENTITVRLSDDDRARLDKLTAALDKLAGVVPNCDSCVQSAIKLVQTTAAPAEPTETSQEPAGAAEEKPAENNTPEQNEPAVAAEEPQEVAEPTPAPVEPAKPSVTLEQIQQKVVELSAAGKKAEAREIVTTYGAKVSDLKDQPDKWDEVWSKLTALEG
jgi:hypothetical protein